MFEHSVKVPRHYKVAANILRRVSVEGASLKTLLYDPKLCHYRHDMLYSLLSEAIKHSNDLDEIFENAKLFEKEPGLNPYLAKILTTEILYGKKALPGDSKPVKTILSYSKEFEQYAPVKQDSSDKKVTRRPRYVRVNTNLISIEDAIQYFKDQGCHFIPCPSTSYDDYLALLPDLTEWDFTQDFHVKTVLVFAIGTNFHNEELCLEKKILLQDKATTLAVHLLAPPPGSIVLDMCAAPGMKTSQIAAFMKNTGKVYAVERDHKRYEILCDMVNNTGCTCVEPLHKDALEVGKGDMNDVEYILVDPSCSGSGMEHSLYDYHENKERLQNLTSFQEKLLKHAMNSFPNTKRIVYSTCSLNTEENERVVLNVVKASRRKWKIIDAKELLEGEWHNHGSGMYGSLGLNCLYARPESDFTIGFFLAVLDRKEKKDPENEMKLENGNRRRNKKDDKTHEKSGEIDNVTTQDEEQQNTPGTVVDCSVDFGLDSVKKTKKKKRNIEKMIEIPDTDKCVKKTKKKKYDEINELVGTVDSEATHALETLSDLTVESETGTHQKKSKKDKKVKSDVSVGENDVTMLETSQKKKRKRYQDTIEDEGPESRIEYESKNYKKTEHVVTDIAIAKPLDEMNALPVKEKKKKRLV